MPLIQFIHLCMMNPFNRRELFLRINNSDVPRYTVLPPLHSMSTLNFQLPSYLHQKPFCQISSPTSATSLFSTKLPMNPARYSYFPQIFIRISKYEKRVLTLGSTTTCEHGKCIYYNYINEINSLRIQAIHFSYIIIITSPLNNTKF
jgi:hypothetical protein